ncbi:MAG: hypothetical protein Q7S02_01700 [bacterium]|nr:hypothetical protein [bacterium]
MSKRTPRSRKQQPTTRFYTPSKHIADAILRLVEKEGQRRPLRQRKP